MPTVICSRCSRPIPYEASPPRSCPDCGLTFGNADDSTNSGGPVGELTETITGVSPEQRTIGRYQVQGELGAGGFGTVYLAYDPKLDRLVALKCPNERVRRRPDVLARFAREGRNAAQLRHPGIVVVYDVEEDCEGPFIVSEFVKGEPLSDYLRRGRMSFRAAASMLAAIASAVQYAHSKKIVHRDIKPSNIMVDEAGNPRLMDFGLAKREDVDETITADNQVIGSIPYMSPEQLAGKSGGIDYRTDIYSLGVTLYQLLTEKLPFQVDARHLRSRVVSEEPPRPRSIDKQIPIDLETICLKAMERNREARYPLGSDLAEDLERWLRGEPILARHIGPLERCVRWCRRNPAPAGLVSTAALLLLSWAVGSSVMAAMAQEARRETEKALQATREALSRQYVEKAAWFQKAGRASNDYAPMRSIPYLLAALEADQGNPDRLVADRIRLQTQLDLAPSVEGMWFTKAPPVLAGISPRGDLFYAAEPDGVVKVWQIDSTDGPPVSLLHPSVVTAAAFSPDGSRLATACADGVRVWKTASAEQSQPLRMAVGSKSQQAPVRSIAFSRSGSFLFTAFNSSGRTTGQIWDVRNGNPVGEPIQIAKAIDAAQFAVLDRFLVFYCDDGSISEWQIDKRSERSVISSRSPGRPPGGIAPDQMSATGLTANDTVIQWNVGSTEKQRTPLTHDLGRVKVVKYAPDGRTIATGTTDGILRVWSVDKGKLLWKAQIFSGAIDQITFSPDGEYIAAARNFAGVAIVDSKTGQVAAQPMSVDVKWVDWSARVGRILTIDRYGTSRLWRVPSNRWTFRLPGLGAIAQVVASGNRRVIAAIDDAGLCAILRASGDLHFSPASAESFPIKRASIQAAAVTEDGSRLAVASDGAISIWDTVFHEEIVASHKYDGDMLRMRFTPDQRLLVCQARDSKGKGTVAVLETATGRPVYKPFDVGNYPTDLDIDRNGKQCLIVCSLSAAIWNLDTGKKEGVVGDQRRRIESARFLGHDRTLLLTYIDGTLALWDQDQSRALHTASGPLLFSPIIDLCVDRNLVLVGNNNETARLWSTQDLSPLSPAFDHSSPVTEVAIAPGGRWSVTLDRDQRLHGWDGETGEPVFENSTLGKSGVRLMFFAPDAQSLHVVTGSGDFATIPFRSDARAFAELAAESSIRCGVERDAEGGLMAMAPSALALLWEQQGKELKRGAEVEKTK